MSPSVEPSDDLVAVGRVTTVHGIRGELVVQPLSDDPGRFSPGATVLLEAPGAPAHPRRVLAAREHKGRLLVQLEGVADRTAAESFRGARLCVREADLPPLAPGSLWLHELPGMNVVDEGGDALGSVTGVIGTGGDRRVLEISGPRGDFLLPFVEQFVRAIDRAGRRITVRLIDGMLP